MTGDGLLDLVVGSSKILFIENTGILKAPTFNTNNPIEFLDPASGGSSVALGDIDNDGLVDMAVGGYHNVFFYKNIGTSTSPSFSSSSTGSISFTQGWQGVALGDMNSDGKLDLVIGHTYSRDLYYY